MRKVPLKMKIFFFLIPGKKHKKEKFFFKTDRKTEELID